MDDLGDRMKGYERQETGRRFLPLLPVVARVDGRNFSRFTKGMETPYDPRLTGAMVELTKRLVEETDALAGYTQSDEISLLWYRPDSKSQIFFDGKIFKIVSVTAALASSIFVLLARNHWPDRVDRWPVTFDCRAFQLPNRVEATNAFLWRELDATKNAISTAARKYFSHNRLMNLNGDQMQELLRQEAGVNFNDYPSSFKRGTFVLRRRVVRPLTPEELERIPPQHRPDGTVERQIVTPVKMPKFRTVTNRVEVLFDNADPVSQ